MIFRFLFTFLFISTIAKLAYSQETKGEDSLKKSSHWMFKGGVTLSGNQSNFTNWNAGGQNSLTGAFNFDFTANYETEKFIWKNNLNQVYSIARIGEDSVFRKVNDVFSFTSSAGYKVKKNTSLIAFANFLTQLSPGYPKNSDFSKYNTNFLSPGYISSGFGFQLTQKDVYYQIIVSPVSSKLTLVTDNSIDGRNFGLDSGKNSRLELGANINLVFEREVMKNIFFKSNMLLFTNYLVEPQNVDINWRNELNIRANKLISVSIILHMIYDHDILIPIYEDVNGVETQVGTGPRTQLMQLFGIGLSYSFQSKDNK